MRRFSRTSGLVEAVAGVAVLSLPLVNAATSVPNTVIANVILFIFIVVFLIQVIAGNELILVLFCGQDGRGESFGPLGFIVFGVTEEACVVFGTFGVAINE